MAESPSTKARLCHVRSFRALSRKASSLTLGASTCQSGQSGSTIAAAPSSESSFCRGTRKRGDTDVSTASSQDSVVGLKDRRADMAAAARRVWDLYNADTPLFTREALQSLASQLDKAGMRAGSHNTVVSLQSIDGRQVQMSTHLGVTSDSGVHPDIVLVNVKPQMDYWTIEKLTGKGAWHVRRFDRSLAYSPVRIGYTQEARFRDANGNISDCGARRIGDLANDLANDLVHTTTSKSRRRCSSSSRGSPQPTKRLDTDDISTMFRRQQAQWESSEACRQLRSTLMECGGLQSRGKTLECPAIRKIVAFACSSLVDDHGAFSTRHATQHAMMLTVRDVLETLQRQEYHGSKGDDDHKDNHSIQCLAQDPMYSDTDCAVLAELGISVVEDPHGFLAVDESTVVIAVAPSVPVRQIVADLARPAAMIWGKAMDAETTPLFEDLGGWDDPASSRVLAMAQEYTELPFPDDSQNFGTVHGMAVYVRKQGQRQRQRREKKEARQTSGLFRKLQRKLLCSDR